MSSTLPVFYIHPQSQALSNFLPILRPHLPYSNPLYNRLQAPQNKPSRRCLFAATFPPATPPAHPKVPEVYTILFADRSRHAESQIWLFNPLITYPSPPALTTAQQEILSQHMLSAILFLKGSVIPEAPGWPFSPILRFSCLHNYITQAILKLAKGKDAIPRTTSWNLWIISTEAVAQKAKELRALPTGYNVGIVPEDQLDIVVSTSSIPRQPSTLMTQPSIGLLDARGKLVAWGYIGVDGSFATLYVLPEERGKGFATYVAVELLRKLHDGGFKGIGFSGDSGWVHSHVYDGNRESEGVMKRLGGKIYTVDSYTWVDSDKF